MNLTLCHLDRHVAQQGASFTEALIIVKIFKIDVFISAKRGKQGGFDGINFI